jgi:hypothetical protein
MGKALHRDLMTPAERLDEIAEILAAGILRVRARLGAPWDTGDDRPLEAAQGACPRTRGGA